MQRSPSLSAPPEQGSEPRRESQDPRMRNLVQEEGEGNFQDDVMGNPKKAAGKQVERTKSPGWSSRVEGMSSRKWGN